jgi:hypothetical protein
MALELDTERQSLLRPEGLDDGGFGAECDDPDGPVMVLPDEAVLWKAGAVMYNFFATGIFTSSIGVATSLLTCLFARGMLTGTACRPFFHWFVRPFLA